MNKSIIYFCVFFTILGSVHALTVKSFSTEIEVYEDGWAKVVNRLVLDSREVNEIIEIPAYNPESLIVQDQNSDLKFASLDDKLIIKPLSREENYEVYTQYVSDNITSKEGGLWIIDYPIFKDFNIDVIEAHTIVVSLPSTATILSSTNGVVTYFESGNLKTSWNLALDKEFDTSIKLTYENQIVNSFNWFKALFYTLLSTVSVLILVFTARFLYDKFGVIISKGKKDVIRALDDREKEVIKSLLDNKNQAYQRNIQKDTSLSKATLSRTIKRLGEKETPLINVRPCGNTNLISLSDWFVKK